MATILARGPRFEGSDLTGRLMKPCLNVNLSLWGLHL